MGHGPTKGKWWSLVDALVNQIARSGLDAESVAIDTEELVMQLEHTLHGMLDFSKGFLPSTHLNMACPSDCHATLAEEIVADQLISETEYYYTNCIHSQIEPLDNNKNL